MAVGSEFVHVIGIIEDAFVGPETGELMTWKRNIRV